MTSTNILALIKTERVKAGLSMAAVAEQLGMSTKGYEHIEYGRRRLLFDTYLQIAKAVGFDPGKAISKITQGK